MELKTFSLGCETRFRIYKNWIIDARNEKEAIKLFLEKINVKKHSKLKVTEK